MGGNLQLFEVVDKVRDEEVGRTSKMEFEETLQIARDRAITKEEALFLFKETEEPDRYLKLFEAATTVREKECGKLFRLDGWMGSNTECMIDPQSYQDRVGHLFYLKELKNFRQLAVTWLKVHPGSPLEGKIIPPSPIEAARTVAISRLIFRNVYINVSDPQHIQLWVMAGANRMVHAGASLHEKGGFSIGGQWVGTGVERIDVGNGYEIMNILPVTARYILDARMEVEPTVLRAVEKHWVSVMGGMQR